MAYEVFLVTGTRYNCVPSEVKLRSSLKRICTIFCTFCTFLFYRGTRQNAGWNARVCVFLVSRALDLMKSTLKYLSDLASLHRFSTQSPGYFLVEQKSYGYISKKSALGLCICEKAQRWKIFL